MEIIRTHFLRAAIPVVAALALFTNLPSTSNATASDHDIYIVPAISSSYISPDQKNFDGALNGDLKISAAPGEVSPASIVVKANKSLRACEMIPDKLFGPTGSIPASIIDIRVVKSWYQAGRAVFQTNKRILVPELLLKDDGLIKVDHSEKNNYLRNDKNGVGDSYILISGDETRDISFITPKDSPTLRPVDIPSGTNKQFWITIKTPETSPPGTYTGKLKFECADTNAHAINIELEVLPIKLSPPALTYSLYYRGRIGKYQPGDPRLNPHRNNKGVVNSNYKTEAQYRAEMINLKEHGVNYPTLYQNVRDEFVQAIQIRKELGLPVDTIYAVGVRPGNNTSFKDLVNTRRNLDSWKNLATSLGVKNLFAYGIDEAEGEHLLSQRSAWQAAHQSGWNVFTAIRQPDLEQMGDLLDVAVVMGALNPELAERHHKKGKKIFSYANPQVGIEDAELYRKNYGIKLWLSGYDGAMNYAYQHSANHIWNDFDDAKYRDHAFTYPTVDGVIDTIAFEGFREGITDVRYLTTLSAAIQSPSPNQSAIAAQAKSWISSINPDGDLQKIREKATEWILILQQENLQDPSTPPTPPNLKINNDSQQN